MPRPHYALAALALLAWTMASYGQTTLTPQAGLVVLRNGQVLEGEVTRAGDYYLVLLGGTSEIRLPAGDVEAVCASLDEAYEFKARHLAGTGAEPHLELAEWCLRHKLHARCAQQLVAVMRLAPGNPKLKLLEERLEWSAKAPAAAAKPAATVPATASAEQIEETIRGLPAGSMEKFSAVIQPLLLNRCGANQCHGPGAKAEFKLLRPPAGQVASRRFTQRNLVATLEQLDSSNPASSPLLTLPQGRHGSALTAVFDKQSQKQLDELTAWVKLTLAANRPNPPTIAEGQTTLSQSASDAAQATAGPAASAGNATQPESVSAMKPAVESDGDNQRTASERFIPRDRFDAEIFNRRFHQSQPQP